MPFESVTDRAYLRIEAGETAEEIGPFIFLQRKNGFKLTQDPLLLVDFTLPLNEDDIVIDLGTGSGIIPLLLAWKSPVKRIVGIEAEENAAMAAQKNVEINSLSSKIFIIKKDFRDLKNIYAEGSFSVVVSNPPYVKAGSGRISPVKERAGARAEIFGGLSDLLEISRYLAGETGRIFYIFPVLRLFEMLREVKKIGLNAKRLKFIHTKADKPAKLFLIEIGSEGGLTIEEPVFIGEK